MWLIKPRQISVRYSLSPEGMFYREVIVLLRFVCKCVSKCVTCVNAQRRRGASWFGLSAERQDTQLKQGLPAVCWCCSHLDETKTRLVWQRTEILYKRCIIRAVTWTDTVSYFSYYGQTRAFYSSFFFSGKLHFYFCLELVQTKFPKHQKWLSAKCQYGNN